MTVHKAAPHLTMSEEYLDQLASRYSPHSYMDLILDRSWFSDIVYGPIFRGSPPDADEIAKLTDFFFGSLHAVMILLDEHNHVLAERAAGLNDYLVKDTETLFKIADGYRALETPESTFRRVAAYITDEQVEELIDFAQQQEGKCLV